MGGWGAVEGVTVGRGVNQDGSGAGSVVEGAAGRQSGWCEGGGGIGGGGTVEGVVDGGAINQMGRCRRGRRFEDAAFDMVSIMSVLRTGAL